MALVIRLCCLRNIDNRVGWVLLVHAKNRCKVPSAIFHLWLTEA